MPEPFHDDDTRVTNRRDGIPYNTVQEAVLKIVSEGKEQEYENIVRNQLRHMFSPATMAVHASFISDYVTESMRAAFWKTDGECIYWTDEYKRITIADNRVGDACRAQYEQLSIPILRVHRARKKKKKKKKKKRRQEKEEKKKTPTRD